MKRAVLLPTLLLAAAGYVFLQTTSPAPKLVTLMPSGALLYLEAPDFGRLLRDWDTSKVKADWLKSANYAVFSRSNLFTKLQEIYSQYGEAAGFLPDLKSVIGIAGTTSALSLYQIRDVEFLYVSRIADADFMKSRLWAVRDKFEQRQAGGVPFYLRTGSASKRTIAFALARGYLLLATRDDLVAQALELIAGGGNPSIASDRWYHDSVAEAPDPGELRLVMNLEALVESVYFRSYWVQRNASTVRRYWAGVADLKRDGVIGRPEGVGWSADRVAVLIQGETGTGKELVAKAVHEESLRGRGPFVKVNCAAMAAGLLESELFGHERGAFTGALNQTTGRFERAHTGTLFLDEIGELPLELQPKLLRALQEKEFERLGGSRTIRVDVRFVAATNQDLMQMVKERRFRADLFYRLNVFPIELPPLRDRRTDIPILVRHFVEKFADRMNRCISHIPEEVIEILCAYDWPGNIRELQNLIERAVIMSSGPELRLPATGPRPVAQQCVASRTRTLHETEREHILKVLDEVGGVVGGHHGAASRLGLPRTSLIYRMRKLGINQGKMGALANVVPQQSRIWHSVPVASL